MTLTRRIKLKFYQCLEHPKTVWQVVFHLGIFCYVLVTLCLSAIMSLDEEHGRKLDRVVFAMEAALAIYFTVEFLLRLWAVGINHHYVGWVGRLRYCTRFISIIDILIVAASLLLLIFGSRGGHYLSGPAVQNLRFLQILRMLHVDRRLTTWRLMEKVLRLHKTELITAFYLSMLGLLVTSTLVYITEGYYTDQGGQGAFNNYGDAIWWGIVTLFTIGYGDIVPKYWVSKLITCFFAITCISLFTLTSSIIGVGLALMVQEKSRKKHIKRLTPFAAKIIQTFWRERMISERFENIPYFKYTLTQRLIAHELTPYEEEEQQRTQENQQRRNTISKLMPLARLRQFRSQTPDDGTRSAGGSFMGFIDSIRIRVGTQSGGTVSSLNLSLSKKRTSAMTNDVDDNDEDTVSTPLTVQGTNTASVGAPIRRFPKGINNMLISHVFNPAMGPKRLYRSASEEDVKKDKEKGHGAQQHRPSEPRKSGGDIMDKNFFRPPAVPSEKGRESKTAEPIKPKVEPEQRMRFRVSAVQSAIGEANVHIEIEEPTIQKRDESPPPSPPSPPSFTSTNFDSEQPHIPTRYVLALSAIWRMKFLVAKKKFRLSRKPFDLQDITERVSENEKQQLARLRKVQARVERLLGPPRPSLLTPNDDRMISLMQRLQLVEMRMAELDKKADLIVYMATQLADRVSNLNTSRRKGTRVDNSRKTGSNFGI